MCVCAHARQCYVFECVCVYTKCNSSVPTCVNVECVNMCVCLRMHVCVYLCICICVSVYMCVYMVVVYTYIHIHIHIHVHKHTHTYMYAYIHTYIHVSVHACMCTSFPACGVVSVSSYGTALYIPTRALTKRTKQMCACTRISIRKSA